ncbi:MAG: hypothetical protein GF372_00805 [Candidatus Marinimicrobia bacterium]|nr:hypothetical protein [Candidatus Neomarinimicrobiota bacterium]
MKKFLIMILLISFSNHLDAQYILEGPEKEGIFTITAGYIIPFGEIGNKYGEFAGGMENGFSLGIEYTQPFDNYKRLAWHTNLTYFRNQTDIPQGFYDIWIRGKESAWHHFTAAVGLRYTLIDKDQIRILAGAKMGGLIGISPEIITNVSTKLSLFNTSSQQSSTSLSYNLNPMFGVNLFQRIELKMEYIFAGMMKYQSTVFDYNGVVSERFFEVPAQFYNFLVSYSF